MKHQQRELKARYLDVSDFVVTHETLYQVVVIKF